MAVAKARRLKPSRATAVLHGKPCPAPLGFKRRATAVLKSNLIRSIEFGTAVSTTFETGLRHETSLSSLCHAARSLSVTCTHWNVISFQCKKGVGRQHTTFTSDQNAAFSYEFFSPLPLLAILSRFTKQRACPQAKLHAASIAPDVQKVDSTIQWINLNPLDKSIGFRNTVKPLLSGHPREML